MIPLRKGVIPRRSKADKALAGSRRTPVSNAPWLHLHTRDKSLLTASDYRWYPAANAAILRWLTGKEVRPTMHRLTPAHLKGFVV